jgi:hypothetical protein
MNFTSFDPLSLYFTQWCKTDGSPHHSLALTVLSDVVTVVDMNRTKFTFQFGQMAVYHLLVLAFMVAAPVDPYVQGGL